ncbi:hypothetical protein M5K25_017983 [Dendrobium thyrsiflorum]|uniref:Uncharacterized protein n=1 Tax=Dendrobium thyrsiflorum TaxID=117978 RepID=A0ABD0UGU6_DENTH
MMSAGCCIHDESSTIACEFCYKSLVASYRTSEEQDVSQLATKGDLSLGSRWGWLPASLRSIEHPIFGRNGARLLESRSALGREPGFNAEDCFPGATKELRKKLEEDNRNLAWSNLCESLTTPPHKISPSLLSQSSPSLFSLSTLTRQLNSKRFP